MRTYGSVIYDSRYSDRLIGVYVAGSRLYAVRQFQFVRTDVYDLSSSNTSTWYRNYMFIAELASPSYTPVFMASANVLLLYRNTLNTTNNINNSAYNTNTNSNTYSNSNSNSL